MSAERKASVKYRSRLTFPKKRDQSKGHDHTSDTSAEGNLNLFPRMTCRSHRLLSEESRELTVRGTQYMLLQSGKWREGKTDSDKRDYSSKESTLSFEVWLHSVQTVIQEELSPQQKNVTGSTRPKSDTLVLLICRNVKKFRTIISEVTER